MAIAFDNATGAAGTGVSSLQWTHTVGAVGAFVAIGSTIFDGNGASSASLNNVALTLQATELWNSSLLTNKLFTGSAGASGALTVSVTTTGGVLKSQGAAICTYTGVNSSAPIGQAGTASGAAATVANFSLSSTNGSVCIVYLGAGNGAGAAFTFTDQQNSRKVVSDGSGLKAAFSDKNAAGATTSFSFSSSSATTKWGFIGIAMTATAVAAFTWRGMLMLGVG